MRHSSARLLVTGAAGQLGRRVVELLIEAGCTDLAVATRDPAKLEHLAARGLEVRRADFDDPGSLDGAFAGIERLLLVSTDALHRPGLRLAQHRAAVAAAGRAGVRHLVYTSSTGPRPQPGGSLLDDHFWTEAAIFGSALDWTVLRDNLYADNLLLSLPRAVATGQLFAATGAGGRAWVTREDCARAATAALLSGEGRRVCEIGGPEAVTHDRLAALVSEVSGRPVTPIAVTPAQYREGLLGAGLPPFLAEALVAFDEAAAQGFHALVTPDVESLTGRAPTPLRDFLSAHRSALAAAA